MKRKNKSAVISTLGVILLVLSLTLVILAITVPGIRDAANGIIRSMSKLIGIDLVGLPGSGDDSGTGVGASCDISLAECQFTVMHAPSVTVDRVKSLLRGSPALTAEPDIAQFFYDESKRTGIDDAVALAFFKHESSFGTSGVAATTKSIGNIKYTATCKDKYGGEDYKGFCKYPTWKAGVSHWYNLIKDGYVGQGYDTLGEILARYAPCDENNLNNYITDIRNTIDEYRPDILSACPAP